MGLFRKNYEKPGKGVSKKERQKKGFFRFFELYSRNLWKLITAQMWYVLLSIPIFTGGLAQVGMAYCCRMAARDKHFFPTADFFGAIKRNWKRALPMGIINALIEIVFILDMCVLYFYVDKGMMNKTWAAVVFAVSMFFFTAFSFAKYYQYTMMITFDYSFKSLMKNSWLFATLGIKHNIIIGSTLTLIYVAAFYIMMLNPQIGIALTLVIGLFIFSSFRCFLIQFNVFPEIKKYIIDPYYKEHPDADIEKRIDLGLLTYDELEESEEAVFDDELPPDTL